MNVLLRESLPRPKEGPAAQRRSYPLRGFNTPRCALLSHAGVASLVSGTLQGRNALARDCKLDAVRNSTNFKRIWKQGHLFIASADAAFGRTCVSGARGDS